MPRGGYALLLSRARPFGAYTEEKEAEEEEQEEEEEEEERREI